MSFQPYEIARIADLERPDGWAPIRKHFDVRSLGINAWTAHEEGGRLIPEHDEVPSEHEELYIVISGHATFTVGDEDLEAPAGTIVYVRDPAVRRGAAARDAETTIVSVGGVPGRAYRPRAWETNADVNELFASGDHEGVKRVLTEALQGPYEDRGHILFNLACAEAQIGEADAAIEHLGEAIREQPAFAEYAKGDSDFDPIRSDPRFGALLS
jgi:tetratricopeptide (TPR) repeat protein